MTASHPLPCVSLGGHEHFTPGSTRWAALGRADQVRRNQGKTFEILEAYEQRLWIDERKYPAPEEIEMDVFINEHLPIRVAMKINGMWLSSTGEKLFISMWRERPRPPELAR